ncbi:hypothetical protein Q3G72_029352 [Acer saccharum]|nr:hypothetical protein Q3G72_029352 [Acer saccharum]
MNSEDLELLCSALSLREKERPVGTLDNNLKVKGERVLSLCLVGKVLTTKVVNREAFINVMHSIWRTSDSVEIEALGRNVFGFHFKNSEDRKLIQSGGPWSFDRALIALEEPTGAGDVTLMKFNRVEIWVQIHNLPLICMTEDSGNFLGSMIGEVKEVDLLEAKRIVGEEQQIQAGKVVLQPMLTNQGNGLGPSGETGHVKAMLVDLPTATGPSGVDQINSLSPSTDQGPDTSLIASQSTPITTLKKSHNSVKWKRAARTKSGGSESGEISSLGKRRPFELNEEIQLNAKRVKEGLLDERDEGGFDTEKLPSSTVIGQMVTHPESVTSQEVFFAWDRNDSLCVSRGAPDCLAPSHLGWDVNTIRANFVREDAVAILSIPLSASRLEDTLLWHYGTNDNYSVKTGYWVVRGMVGSPSASFSDRLSFWWKRL